MIRVAGTLLLAAIALVLAGWLFYWSWCWGWWGQGSLVLRYLWQCQCPPQSEEARYPQRIDVLVPACIDTGVYALSPEGRYLLLIYPLTYPYTPYPSVRDSRPDGLYLYDVQNQELKPADFRLYPDANHFVTEDWLLAINPKEAGKEEKVDYALVNIHDGRRLPLNWVPMTPDHRLEPGALHPFQTAEQVSVIPDFAGQSGMHGTGLAVALAPDFTLHPDANFVLGRYFTNPTPVSEITRTLEDNGITYQIQIPFAHSYSEFGMLSRNGLFRYRSHIYLRLDNQRIVEGYKSGDFMGRGWIYQDRGVILGPEPTFVIGGHPGGLFVVHPLIFPVPQPILLLKVPKEYLSPELQQQEEARQAQEDATREQGAVTIRIGLGALVGVITLAMLWHHSGRRATGSNSQADVGR